MPVRGLSECLRPSAGHEDSFDPGFDHLSGGGAAAGAVATRRNAGGFALYGGPHILNLVTEVATKALKAVRFQKFNNHIRLRPEALAARIELYRLFPSGGSGCSKALVDAVGSLQRWPSDTTPPGPRVGHAWRHLHRCRPGRTAPTTCPWPFRRALPMHPAYGAGHATVAGACVTILKAFFDTSSVLVQTASGDIAFQREKSRRYPDTIQCPCRRPDATAECHSHPLHTRQLSHA